MVKIPKTHRLTALEAKMLEAIQVLYQTQRILVIYDNKEKTYRELPIVKKGNAE